MTRVGLPIRALMFLSLVAGTATVASAQTGAGCKVAYVAAQPVLAQTPGYTAAESIWTKEFEGYRSEIAKLTDSLNKDAAKFEESSAMLSPTNRDAGRKKLEAQQAALDARQQELTQRAGARRQELLAPIESRVTAIIEGIRAENNITMIFDVSQQSSNILTADKACDLTQRVVDRLKSGSTAPAPAPGAKKP
ncbi:MAG: OmpH family outer membrane protein [Gemmatimonadales bacterium]